jgi:hypothetical protein
MKTNSRKRMAISGMLAATLVGGAGMLITPSTLATSVLVQDANPAEKLPSAEEIIKKFVEATGGEEAYKARKSVVTKAKMAIPMAGINADLTITQVAPNKMATSLDLGGFGTQKTVFDGDSAWEISTMAGPRLLTGAELDAMKRQANFDVQINPAEYYKSMETIGQSDFNGEQAYAVKLVSEDGGEVTQYYSVESGLMLGQSSKQMTQMGEVDSKTVMEDYRKVGNLMMPHKMTIEIPAMGMTQNLTISSIEVDVDVDPAIFAMPDEIKQLKQQQDGAAG